MPRNPGLYDPALLGLNRQDATTAMSTEFQNDVFLSHNQADKPPVRRLAERLRAVERELDLRSPDFGLRTSAGGGRLGLERSTVGRGNLPFRDPANAGRRFIPLLLAHAHRHKEPVADCDLEPA